jgi:hypothetical protein
MPITKFTADIILDAACDYIKNNVTEMYVCSGANSVATRAAAITAALATKTGLTSGSFTGPADGTTSGRKMTKNAESAVSIGASGDATHIALCSGTTLLSVVSMTLQNLTAGGTVNVPAFRVIEIADVTQ